MSAAPILARQLKYTVTISQGARAGEKFHFEQPSITVGRGTENNIVLADDPKISRAHAAINIVYGQLQIKNLSPKNFILVNNQKVEEFTVESSAELKLGDTVFLIQIDNPLPAVAEVPSTTVVPASPLKPTSSVIFNPPPLVPPTPPPRMAPNLANPGAAPRVSQPQQGSKMTFYILLLVVLGGGLYLFNGSQKAKRAEIALRRETESLKDIETSATAIEEIEKSQLNRGEQSLQYKTAQEHYIKGFRDYRQGQYSRAMQSFQAAMSFYPQHDLAKKYWTLSKRKFDEVVQYNMIQGRRYLAKNNYRMCKASFANVMIMMKDPNETVYKEAKQFYSECTLRLEGRY